MTRNKHNKDKKLHNSHQPDLTWQEMTDLSPEDEIEGGPKIYYFTDDDCNIHRASSLIEWSLFFYTFKNLEPPAPL